jgi:hypothetical protein
VARIKAAGGTVNGSLADVGKAIGTKSRTATHRALHALAAAGLVRLDTNRDGMRAATVREVAVIGAEESWAAGEAGPAGASWPLPARLFQELIRAKLSGEAAGAAGGKRDGSQQQHGHASPHDSIHGNPPFTPYVS